MIKRTEDEFLPESSPGRVEARDARPAPSGLRRTSEVPVAEPWRDALLRLSLELPIDMGLQEMTRLFLDRLQPVLPTVALGVCVVDLSDSEPILMVRLPSGFSVALDRDPTRLFPKLPDEHVLALEEGVTGSTFHIACTPPAGALTAFHVHVAERAALVLGSALARARTYQKKAVTGEALLELRARLVQAEKLASLGQMVAGVVHELNNPLTSILAYADYLTRQLDSGAVLKPADVERLRRISEAAERVLKFSRDLVTYARPTPDAPEDVSLSAIVDTALRFCEHEFTLHGIEVVKRFALDLPDLLGVAGQLTQVFVNLFTNAVHAMSETGGILTIEALLDSRARLMIIEVTDTGCGIAPEHLSQVFEPFFTTKADGLGTGLGLSIVREILDVHGGSVVARSAEEGGTTFRLELPVGSR